jgi:hypothetical protein
MVTNRVAYNLEGHQVVGTTLMTTLVFQSSLKLPPKSSHDCCWSAFTGYNVRIMQSPVRAATVKFEEVPGTPTETFHEGLRSQCMSISTNDMGLNHD